MLFVPKVFTFGTGDCNQLGHGRADVFDDPTIGDDDDHKRSVADTDDGKRAKLINFRK
jgi:hypothetical protein